MKAIAKISAAWIALVGTAALAEFAWAGGCCDRCGCDAGCGKVCRLVCEMKEVKVKCWGVQCEDFCLGGPCTQGCTHSESKCGDGCCSCGLGGKFAYVETEPGCPRTYTKKKLMLKIVTKKVPTYTWKVENLCGACESKVEGAPIEPGAVVPPAPKVEAHFKYGPVLPGAVHVEPVAMTAAPLYQPSDLAQLPR